VTCFDGAAADEIERRGGLAAIAISHPHYYSGMADWAARFDCPVLLHAADEQWITRPDPAIELWDGETREVGDGLTLVRCGGHFAGGTVLHYRDGADGSGALLSGDIVQVIPDRTHVGFMYSYPNLIPLPEASVQHIVDTLEPYEFEVIYGAWWERLVRRDAKAIVRRSADRYSRALRGELAP
jgi:glyoxylase-like metal-dependent hydrolase (beta-lactamase superfamily II)